MIWVILPARGASHIIKCNNVILFALILQFQMLIQPRDVMVLCLQTLHIVMNKEVAVLCIKINKRIFQY